MKRKYFYILGVVIILVSFAAVGVKLTLGMGKTGYGRVVEPLKPMVTMDVPDPQTIREMERLEDLMEVLTRTVPVERSSVDLKLFGYEPVQKGKYLAGKKAIRLPPDMNYSLTLAFSAGTKRFCVIGGGFYREGASLPDGGKIISIEPNRVRIKKESFTAWVPVGKQEETADNNKKHSGEKT